MKAATAFSLTVYGGPPPQHALDEAVQLYRTVYAEPPYNEGEQDFAPFAQDLPRRAGQPNFRLVIAHESERAVGFAMGHDLAEGSRWWEGTSTPLPANFTTEYPGRTFAVIELAVLADHRCRGLGRSLHAHLTVELPEERITLLVRPDASPASSAYRSWGYIKVDRIQPFTGGPVYDLMIRELR